MNSLVFDEFNSVVYIDPLWYCCKTKTWRYNYSCHMFVSYGTNLNQLHAFARDIGIARMWFHYSKTGVPHYDLNPDNRKLAIENGAIELSRKDAVKFFKEYKENKL